MVAVLGGCLGLLLASWLSDGPRHDGIANGGTLLLSTAPRTGECWGFAIAISFAGMHAGERGTRMARAADQPFCDPGLKEVPAGSHHTHGQGLRHRAACDFDGVCWYVAALFVGALVKLLQRRPRHGDE